MRNYKSVDGRTYIEEENLFPFETEEYTSFSALCGRTTETVNIRDLLCIEKFLNGEEVDSEEVNPSREDVIRISQEYELQKKGAFGYSGPADSVFEILCAKFPNASKYKKYKGVLYAMRYGDAPCRTYFATKNNT